MELALDDNVEQLEWKFRIGMEFNSEPMDYKYYNEYGKRLGFSIRRHYTNKRFNHHQEVMVFGATLMYNKDIESFKWLSHTFLEAMSNSPPQIIIIDQDAAMAKSIPNVMPITFHKLCKWHIMQNSTKHVSRIVTMTKIDSNMSTKPVKDKLAYFINHIDEGANFLTA
ncbi:hypothetical protein L1049_020179 [Liquidambar formosana]|uniref:Protein FAR1-RELATED SEQUENCE n=1 Tax=Liquidambar formosana TaxID=63359 RepID=A0AAP0SCD8_LIQFO